MARKHATNPKGGAAPKQSQTQRQSQIALPTNPKRNIKRTPPREKVFTIAMTPEAFAGTDQAKLSSHWAYH